MQTRLPQVNGEAGRLELGRLSIFRPMHVGNASLIPNGRGGMRFATYQQVVAQ